MREAELLFLALLLSLGLVIALASGPGTVVGVVASSGAQVVLQLLLVPADSLT